MERFAALACGRRDQNHGAAPLRNHHARRRVATRIDGFQVLIDRLVPLRLGHLINGRFFPDAGVGDENIERAEARHGRVDHLLDCREPRHVCTMNEDVCAKLFALFRDGFSGFAVAFVVDDDAARSCLRKHRRRGRADAA